MAVENLKTDSSQFSSEYLLKLKKVFNLILNDVPDNRDDTIILKLIDSLKANLSVDQSNQEQNEQNEIERMEKRFSLVFFLGDYLSKEILTNDDSSKIDFSNSKLNEDKEAEVLSFFFDLLNLFVKSSRLLSNDAEKFTCKNSNKNFSEKSRNLNIIFSNVLDKILHFIQSFFDTKFDPTNLKIESSVCCSVLSLVEEMYEYFESNQTSKFSTLLDNQLFSIESLHLFLNIDYKSLFVRRAFKQVLKKHVIHLISQAATQNKESIERLDRLYSRISKMDINVKIHNLDFYAQIFRFYFFENKETSFSSKLNNFKILCQLKKLNSHIDFKNLKTNFLIDHNFSLDENAIESFAQILTYDIIFSFIHFDEENLNAILLTSDQLVFYKTFLKYLNSVSIHHCTIHSNQIDNKIKRSTDLLFKFHIYLYAILNEWQSGYNADNNHFLSNTLGMFSSIDKEDSKLSIKEQINLLKFKIIRYMLVPLRVNLNINDTQIYDSAQIGELIGDLGKEFDSISSNIIHIKSKYDPYFDSLLDEQNYLILINDKSYEYKQLLLKQSLINFKIFMRKFNLFSTKLNIFNLVNVKQIVHILRHMQIDFQIKRLLLQVLNDYFISIDKYNIYASHFLQEIIASLNLKIKDSFDEYLFKLVGLFLKNLSLSSPPQSFETIKVVEMNLIEGINLHLEKYSQTSNLFLEQFELVLKFLLSTLNDNEIDGITFDFIISALNKNDNFLVKKSNEYLLFIDNDETETIKDLKESILLFYESLFVCLRRRVEHCLNNRLANKVIVQIDAISHKFENIIDESFLLCLEEISLSETEAFARRSLVNFLKSYRLYQFYKSICCQLNFLDELWNSCKYFCYFLNNEFDWQVQMYCLEYLQSVFSLSFLLLENGELSNEIMYCLSNCLKSLINSIDDFDQHVRHMAVSLLIQIKQNPKFVEQFVNLDENLFKKETKTSRLNTIKANLNAKNIKVSVWSDENNLKGEEYQIKEILNTTSVDLLKIKLNESKQTSDIYIRNPIMILDDIISSYQFDLDEEKAVDCY